jgi:hypothetical protein
VRNALGSWLDGSVKPGQRPELQFAAVPTSYLTLVREMKSAYNHRLRLVAHARQHGIKPTARLFQTTVPTVREWRRRANPPLPG